MARFCVNQASLFINPSGENITLFIFLVHCTVSTYPSTPLPLFLEQRSGYLAPSPLYVICSTHKLGVGPTTRHLI
eukprot:m.16560 g.16560  ORF g.16560 m.16560 type:complete len:75 (+) comp8110_c0_seq1:85-309(+)